QGTLELPDEGAEYQTAPCAVIFGYKVRLTAADWWNRNWGTAKYLQGASYAVGSRDYQSDSDLIHETGFMTAAAEGDGASPEEAIVLLGAQTTGSAVQNRATVA
ncbi:hypothetical protein PZH32_12465, partial [Adlercreutzia equolifaciens]|uniref:hypothetical protein n=1 Tax=Adlercreutzia equolifaciens TaxID=446660 RepID=UPI0023B08712